MFKTIELNRKQLLETFFSMTAIRKAISPDTQNEINLNFETSRNALETIDANIRAMEENPEILRPTILELVLYEIDLGTLPETVSQEIKDLIPDFLLNQN